MASPPLFRPLAVLSFQSTMNWAARSGSLEDALLGYRGTSTALENLEEPASMPRVTMGVLSGEREAGSERVATAPSNSNEGPLSSAERCKAAVPISPSKAVRRSLHSVRCQRTNPRFSAPGGAAGNRPEDRNVTRTCRPAIRVRSANWNKPQPHGRRVPREL